MRKGKSYDIMSADKRNKKFGHMLSQKHNENPSSANYWGFLRLLKATYFLACLGVATYVL